MVKFIEWLSSLAHFKCSQNSTAVGLWGQRMTLTPARERSFLAKLLRADKQRWDASWVERWTSSRCKFCAIFPSKHCAKSIKFDRNFKSTSINQHRKRSECPLVHVSRNRWLWQDSFAAKVRDVVTLNVNEAPSADRNSLYQIEMSSALWIVERK